MPPDSPSPQISPCTTQATPTPTSPLPPHPYLRYGHDGFDCPGHFVAARADEEEIASHFERCDFSAKRIARTRWDEAVSFDTGATPPLGEGI